MKTNSLSTKQVLIVIAAVILGVALFATPAFANPFYAAGKARSAVATSTLSYMTPGTATSTVVYDSYEVNGTNQVNQGNLTIPNTIAFAVQGVGSSTALVINVACEFSEDNLDWYQNEIFLATTSNPVNISVPNTFTLTNATSTIGGVAFNGIKKIVTCPVPLRYVRAVTTVTGDKAAVWTALIPTKQRN